MIYATAFGTETEIGANLAQIHLLSWHEILSGNIKKAAENQMILINSIPYFKIREQFVAEIDQWLKDLLIEKMNRLETDVVEKTLNRHECIEDAAEFIHPSTIAA